MNLQSTIEFDGHFDESFQWNGICWLYLCIWQSQKDKIISKWNVCKYDCDYSLFGHLDTKFIFEAICFYIFMVKGTRTALFIVLSTITLVLQ